MDDALLPTQLKNEKKCDFTHTLTRLFQVESTVPEDGDPVAEAHHLAEFVRDEDQAVPAVRDRKSTRLNSSHT